MSALVGLDLATAPTAILVASGGGEFSRGDVRRQADELIAEMAARGVTRAMVRSDDPLHVLRAVDACSRAGVDLFIAHVTVPDEHIEAICADNSVQLVIGEEIVWRDLEAAPASGRILMMTSGTTGRPKVASHTLETLLARVRNGARKGAVANGRWLLTYQTTGFAGVQVVLTAALTKGLVVAAGQRNPAGFYEAARRYAVNQISGTPTFWRSLLMVARPGELDLRQITLGGEASDQVTLDRIRAAFPEARITHTYASTEAGVVYAVHDGQEGFPANWLDRMDGPVQLRVRDGFLQIKTANAMRGYLTEASQPLLGDGWLSTSDRVEIAGERVRIIGRDDATINVGGSKVYPLAIETFLLRQPGVAEARVFGIPNPISGALVAAEIVLESGLDAAKARQEILASCRAELPAYQQPRMFKIVDEIEVRTSGKKG
ncbi:class I adenylate-forming enzyme family protein [Devosia faecipullorum]|uniref:class I adenylate-forming enzyme family protein n=1 Tax=Devosia faecipullorum TaxID=2755039 RepID=UPI00187B7F9B|nr:fatty acid--CoA ligase family protein [Devosia faecipullorum]MBE7731970.1 long-chain fatty acid--CoA ligase [Devosia faecipullorum]